jgi:heme/copper-type cytochrome/quinol oxidase subunit 2
MRLKFARYLCVSMFLFSPGTRGQDSRVTSQTSQGADGAADFYLHSNLPRAQEQQRNIQVIQMTAKKYGYSPSPVHVKRGTKVQLKITAIDRDHGFTIAPVPEGADPTKTVGLEFTTPQPKDSWKLKKGKETTIEFVAQRAGSYEFRCSVACGLGHGHMKGQLIVDP